MRELKSSTGAASLAPPRPTLAALHPSPPAAAARRPPPPQEPGGGKQEKKKVTQLGLTAKKEGDFGEWYSQVVVESEMISYYDVSGACVQQAQHSTAQQGTAGHSRAQQGGCTAQHRRGDCSPYPTRLPLSRCITACRVPHSLPLFAFKFPFPPLHCTTPAARCPLCPQAATSCAPTPLPSGTKSKTGLTRASRSWACRWARLDGWLAGCV